MKPIHYGSWIMYSVHQSGPKDNINKATHATELHKAPTSGPWESVFRTGPIDCITLSLVPDKQWTWSFGRSGIILFSSFLHVSTSWHFCWGKIMSSDMFLQLYFPEDRLFVLSQVSWNFCWQWYHLHRRKRAGKHVWYSLCMCFLDILVVLLVKISLIGKK